MRFFDFLNLLNPFHWYQQFTAQNQPAAVPIPEPAPVPAEDPSEDPTDNEDETLAE